jgi:hypothetical protein
MLKSFDNCFHLSLVDPNAIDTFEDFVLFVAENIFVQALGRPVTDSLLRNFHILDPKLKGLESDKLSSFQKLLRESFGDFYVSIMQIIVEEVCILLNVQIPDIERGNFMQTLEILELRYCNDDPVGQ